MISKNKWDILIAGGGLGGVAAAIRAASMGCSVLLIDENKWLGGQVTSQGVSALDEHTLMETFGGTALYYDFRDRIRKYYRKNYKLSEQGLKSKHFNPGCSERYRRLAFEPLAGVRVIYNMLAPGVKAKRIKVLKPAKVVRLYKEGRKITGAAIKDLQTNDEIDVEAYIFIDSTELGNLLPLAGIPYTKGVESFAQTHEPSAPPKAMSDACQAINYTFVLERKPGTNNTIPKPNGYDEVRKKHRFSLCGFKMFERRNGSISFWTYRRIIDAANFQHSSMPNDITLINCACTDYKEDSIIDKKSAVVSEHLNRAKQLALCYLYWIQTEAPRDDGGKGYPELKLRKDLVGTSDGLAQHPYIRESRRIKGICTVKEDDVISNYNNKNNRARMFHDSIGIGWYDYIDIHWCCNTNRRYGSGQRLLPFQIPMGAILTNSAKNFIAGGKNISTTHITNGAYRFHPVEWNIGESAGMLGAFSVKARKTPKEVYNDKCLLRCYQLELLDSGIPLFWFDDVPLKHKSFKAIQFLAIEGIISGASSDLHFNPYQKVTKAFGTQWLHRAKIKYGLSKKEVTSLEESMQNITRAQFADLLYKTVLTKATSC